MGAFCGWLCINEASKRGVRLGDVKPCELAPFPPLPLDTRDIGLIWLLVILAGAEALICNDDDELAGDKVVDKVAAGVTCVAGPSKTVQSPGSKFKRVVM